MVLRYTAVLSLFVPVACGQVTDVTLSEARLSGTSALAPDIASVTPDHAAPGATIVLAGEGFTNTTAVMVQCGVGAACYTSAAFTIIDDTRLDVVVPAAALSGFISVEGLEGQDLWPSFTVDSLAPPTLDSFSPSEGGLWTEVNIFGSGFAGVTAVAFGGAASTAYFVVSDTQITAYATAGVASGVVRVTNSLGAVESVGSFTFFPPVVVTDMVPTSGKAGDTVTITGTGLAAVAAQFENDSVPGAGGRISAAIVSATDTTLEVTVPAGAMSGQIWVGHAYSNVRTPVFSIVSDAAPTVTSISPTSDIENAVVTIYGAGFTGVTGVSFGGVPAVRYYYNVADGTLRAFVPIGAADGLITVTNTLGSGQSPVAFNVILVPRIDSFDPTEGVPGTTVTLTGERLDAATGFYFADRNFANINLDNWLPAAVLSTTPTVVQVVVPGGAITGRIVAFSPDGRSGTLAGFTVNSIAAPTITSFSPAYGNLGTEVTVVGTGFDGVQGLQLNGATMDLFAVQSSTQLTFIVNGTPTTGLILVQNSLGSAESATPFVIVEPPVVSGVSPASGAPGDTVAVTGVGLADTAEVLFGGVAALAFSVVDDTLLYAVVPPHAPGLVEVMVTSQYALDGTLAAAFTYVAPPTLATVTPAVGPTTGGTLVALTGSGFQAGMTVRFGGVEATGVSVLSDTSAEVTTAPRFAGAVDVLVTNPDGQTAVAVGAFTYQAVAAPTLSAVAPASGPATGGTAIVLTGTGFSAGATVSLGGASATVTGVSPTELTAVTGPRAAGVVPVIVRNPDGQTAKLVSGFAYLPAAAPTVSGIAPASGSANGGTTVVIAGSGFAAGVVVSVGGVPATVIDVSATEVTAVTGGHAASVVDVVLRNADGQTATLSGGFTYEAAPAPTLTGIAPDSGPSTGGTSVTLTGTNFTLGTTVRIGGVSAIEVVGSAVELVATTAGHAAGVVDVVVQNPDGQTATLAGAFTYVAAPPPTLAAVTPSSGTSNGGTRVTLAGTGFAAETVVTFDGVAATEVSLTNATVVTARTPAHVAGPVDVRVVRPDGLSVTLADGFTYVAAVAPEVTAIEPVTGPSTGNTLILITGSAFAAGATVVVGDVAATAVQVVAPTTILASTGAHAAGLVAVVVTNPDGQSGTLNAGYTYQAAPAPSVADVAPTSGPAVGGTSVVLTGTGFDNGASVAFGGVAGTDVLVSSDTTLSATTPAHPAGAVDIVVTNPDAQVGTLVAGFTYLPAPAPTVLSVTPSSGSTNGGLAVTVAGTGFAAGATLSLGGVAAADVVVASATSMTATTPAHAVGVVDVVVTNPDDASGTLSGGFTYVAPPAPTISAVTPASGPAAGGTLVTINGENFVVGATVSLGGVAATGVAVASSTSMTATTGAHAGGAVDVLVTNPDAQSGTLTSGFTYVEPPQLTAVAPAEGPAAGGTAITVIGSHFVAGITLELGGVTATDLVVVDAGTLTATTPPHLAGDVDVVVTNSDGQTAELPLGFRYLEGVDLVARGSGCSCDVGHGAGGGAWVAAGLWLAALGRWRRARVVGAARSTYKEARTSSR